jgi:hypothetical protein
MATVLLLTIGIVAALMGGMAVGVIFGRKELRGSCGGTAGPDCLCAKAGQPGSCEDGKRPRGPALVAAERLATK